MESTPTIKKILEYMTNQKNQTKYLKNRKNLRLKNYDYASDGAYFVTICTNHRECLFGDIIDGQMCLNGAGQIVEKIYHDLENKFANIQCGEYVIMPNHFHCVIHICNDVKSNVGVVPCANPLLGQPQGIAPTNGNNGSLQKRADIESAPTIDNGFVGVESISTHVSLPQIIQTFKRQTTIEYINGVKTKNWQPFYKRLWQRNYYEHIIRNEKSYNEIIKYIQQNPLKWELDELNPKFENKNAIKNK